MTYLGLALLDALLLATGLAVLRGMGLVGSGRDALRHAGLALVAGWAALGILETWALILGAPLDWWVVVLLCLAIGAAGTLAGRRVPVRRMAVLGEPGHESWIAVAGAAVVVVQLGALFRRAVDEGAPLQWDAWAFWLPKARSIVDFGGLDTGIGGFTSFASPGYPPLVPALDASAFAFMGSTQASPLAVQEWVIAVAFFAALWSLMAERVRPAILWPCLALLALLPISTALISSSLGDEPLMLLLGLGGACAALWLLERDTRFAALAGLFLAAATLSKNEGLPPAIVIGVTMVVAALARSPRRLLVPVLVLVAPLAALVPWRIWMSANGLSASPDYHLADLLHPAVLGDRLSRLSYAAGALPSHVFSPDRWLLAVPLMLAAAILAAPRAPALSILSIAAVGTVVAALLLVYWIGFPPIGWYVQTSVDRVVASAVVMAAVFLPLLLAEASRRDTPSG